MRCLASSLAIVILLATAGDATNAIGQVAAAGGEDAGNGKYTVCVYMSQGGQWVKQDDRTLVTDDEDQALAYVAQVKRVAGWTATSNLPNRELDLADRDRWEGVLPVAADGRLLNMDFEAGTLKDWTATGTAFKGQPIEGDAVAARRNDMTSGHQGRFWIGTFERGNDEPQGTLTSAAFQVTHRWASFLVGGGHLPATCVELVRKDTGQVVARRSGSCDEHMRRTLIDLNVLRGKEIFIRLVDKSSSGWGHINFDDFRFHD